MKKTERSSITVSCSAEEAGSWMNFFFSVKKRKNTEPTDRIKFLLPGKNSIRARTGEMIFRGPGKSRVAITQRKIFPYGVHAHVIINGSL